MKLAAISFWVLSIIAGAARDPRNALRGALKRNSLNPHSPSAIFKRQVTTQCADACADDAAAAAGLQTCGSTDIICICTYLSQITANCLACVVAAEDVPVGELQSACAAATMSAPVDSVTITDDSTSSGTGTGTSSSAEATGTEGPCGAQCASASDQAAGQLITACDVSDTACICDATSMLSAGCLTCTLTEAGITAAEFDAACGAAASTLSGSTSTTATRATNTAGISTTSQRVSSGSSGSSTRSSTSTSGSSASSPSTTQSRAAAVGTKSSGALLAAVAVLVGIVMA